MRKILSIVAVFLASASFSSVNAQMPTLPDKATVADAYVYLLGRAITIRQEKTDIAEEGVDYNVIKYNPLGSADFVNPNLDVAYLEAWIAVDDSTPVVLEVPEILNRYYDAQILNEWGEVITNINERHYPTHPFGKFAFVAPGSTAAIPEDAIRIELHSHKAKMLARVELKNDRDGAVALQKQFKMEALGTPEIAAPAPIADFSNKELIGVEIFQNSDAVIASAMDVSQVGPEMQAKVMSISKLAKDPEHRAWLDTMIKDEVVPEFLKFAVTKSGVFQNNWLATLGTGNYGPNYWIRTSANLVGLWANSNDEVIYFVGTVDENGEPLNGANDYVIEFPAGARPDAVVNSYWSVILVDVPDYRVVPNPLNRFNLNSSSGLTDEADGSLKILLASKHNAEVPETNWLPAPDGKPFSLTFRTYVPKDVVIRGEWFPPAIKKLN